MKIKNLLQIAMAIICLQNTITAASEAAPVKKTPPVLLRMYDKFMTNLKEGATIIDADIRKEAEALMSRLRAAGGSEEAEKIKAKLAEIEQRASGAVKEAVSAIEQEFKPAPTPEVQPQVVAPAPVSVPVPAAAKKEEDTIPVRVSPLARIRGREENITLSDNEPLTSLSYGELLETQLEHKEPLILARVVTRDAKNNAYVHYFDAFSFNQWRFGPHYPLSGKLVVEHTNDPINKLGITDEIRYFSYDPEKPEEGFQYAFSENDVVNNPEVRVLIDEFQNMNEARKTEALERAKGEFVRAPIPQKTEALIPAEEQAYEPILAPGQNLLDLLGQAFREAYGSGAGQAIEKRNAEIARYNEQAAKFKRLQDLATQTANPVVQAEAWVKLGKKYYFGNGAPRDYGQAVNYFERATRQTASPTAAADGHGWLGELYLKGGNGESQDYGLARAHFDAALNQNASPKTKAEAQWRLGQIYLQGLGVPVNLTKAHDYLTAARDQSVSMEARVGALARIPDLDRQMQEEAHLKRALAESKESAEAQNRLEEQQLREAMASSLKEQQEAAVAAKNVKNIIDELLSVEDVLKKNNKLDEQSKTVHSVIYMLQTSKTPSALVPLMLSVPMLKALDGTIKIKYFGQPTTLSFFLDPIIANMDKQIARLKK